MREIWVVTAVAAAEIGSGGGGLAKWRWLAGKGKSDDWSRWKLGSPAMAAELAMVEAATALCIRAEFAESLALSSAKASQNALCVTKLSFLEKRVPQSHLYSFVPQVLE